MRILFVGDVVGRSGRSILFEEVPGLREARKLDAVIVNGENAAGGFGLTAAIAREFLDCGVDLITLGNHAWDQRELVGQIDREPRIIRPLNLSPGAPGRGVGEMRTGRGKRVVVIQVIGRLFMNMHDCAFRALEQELAKVFLGGNADAIIVDVHAEATSEKMALGHFLDGRVSLVVGTHTHVPTADHRVLKKGTAYITDLGMTGDYDSVIGMDADIAIQRWRSPVPGPRLEPASGAATLCGVIVETDDRTGLARSIEPVRIGGCLSATS
ncbi:MAG: TIGR00282 family metallophosphoesterase [Geminicoccaceae bacterium]